jgi:DNA helicase-2/ATP-dependent DNA helicase PcrA
MSSPWLEGLNDAQRAAVAHGDGPLLVIAGAGTGKTKTLACRVAHLIDQGVPPERILLLTFTRRASAEMLGRAGRMIGPSAARVWGGTFHAVANRLLRIYAGALGMSADFTVVDQADAGDMMNLIRNEKGLARLDKRFPRKETLVRIYSRTVNAGDKLSGVLERYFPWCEHAIDGIRTIFEAFSKRKRDNNVLDYDDLLLFWRALVTKSPAAQTVADRFDHILVDEYQDTNSLQGEILIAMRRDIKNIMVVGDDAQSIYSFRAATIRNILDFPKQFPGARIVTLEQNYRSTEPILDASNAVMAQAAERYTKNLFSHRGSGQRPVLITCTDEPEQCLAVCGNILSHLEQGIALKRQAVLFRAGHHSDQLEVELARRKIPFHKYGGLKFIEAAHVKDMLALLRVLENPWDELSWFRMLMMIDGVGPASARRIVEELGVRREVPTEAAESPPGEYVETEEPPSAPASIRSPLRRLFDSPPKPPAGGREQFASLRMALAHCVGLKLARGSDVQLESTGSEPALSEQVARIREFYEPLFERRYENPVIRLRDIEQLEQIAAGYKSRNRFITDLTLDPPTSTSDLAGAPYLEEDYLILSTMHSAKGCEWDVVHIIHAADGMIPSDMATENTEGVDEERRLFYVAMTRAKDNLYVYFPIRYYHTGSRMRDAHSYAQLTRFISPEVKALFEQRLPPGVEPRGASDGAAFPRRIDTAEDVRRQLGDLFGG